MENKHICTNREGEALFYITVTDNQEEITMNLECSIERQIISNKDTERIIGCIEERLVKGELREHFVQKLFSLIRKIPGIEKYYLGQPLSA